MLRELRENYQIEKAKLNGEARSEARMIKSAKDIPEIASELENLVGPQVARPMAGKYIRMKDGDPMQFFTDGSIRHAAGAKPGKAARKIRKKLLREQRRGN